MSSVMNQSFQQRERKVKAVGRALCMLSDSNGRGDDGLQWVCTSKVEAHRNYIDK